MARVLIVGGGCRGRSLAARLVQEGRHAVRITTRFESSRAAIEASGAECLIGTPDRLASMGGALDGVTIACWMLASAQGEREHVRALHGSRLESFLSQAIDTTVRGFVYDADAIAVARETLREGERIVRAVTARNAIPAAILRTGARDAEEWLTGAWAAIEGLIEGRDDRAGTLSSR